MSLRTLRNGALGVLRSAGLFSRSADSPSRRERLLILCYHGIALEDEERWRGHLYIPLPQFRKRMEQLRAFGANVLPLAEAMERLRKHSLPPRSVVITFDDGFYDFHRHAAPLLREFGFPATVYLTTYYCRNPRPLFNLMADYLLWKSGLEQIELAGFGFTEPLPIANPQERQKVTQQLVKWVADRQCNHEEDALAQQIAEAAGLDYSSIRASRKLQLMNPEEVVEMHRSGIGIELHTHRHRTPRDRELFVREIRDNSMCIEEMTGAHPTHFCYPSGDYDRVFFPWLSDFGVDSATTCQGGLAAAQSEPLLLPRMLDDSFVSEVQFDRWLSGFRL